MNAVDYLQNAKSQWQPEEIPLYQCISDTAPRASTVPESVVQEATTSCTFRTRHTSLPHVMLKVINHLASGSIPMPNENEVKARCLWSAFTRMLTPGALQSVQITGTAANREEPPELRIPVCQ
jgi:hypothetical protein